MKRMARARPSLHVDADRIANLRAQGASRLVASELGQACRKASAGFCTRLAAILENIRHSPR